MMPTGSEPTPSAHYEGPPDEWVRQVADPTLEQVRAEMQRRHAAEVERLEAEKRELEGRLRLHDAAFDDRLRAQGR